MILPFLILLIKSKVVNHDCNSNYADFNRFENESLNYKISCSSQKIQKISLKNKMHIKSITISGETKATITCDPKLQNITLYIFDKPIIKFNENCYFNTVEIFDSPTITLPQNKQVNVEKLILSNYSYKNIFQYQRIYSTSNHKQIQSNNVFLCKSNFEFDLLLNDVHIKCNNSFGFSINYNNFQYFQFINYNNNPITLKNISIGINFDYDLLNSILKSIFTMKKKKLFL